MSKNDDYEVGFGKPPKSGMFTRGHSGNPKGRPKGARNFRTEVEDVLNSKVTVHEAGKKKTMRTSRAALLRLKEKALNGDHRALDRLLSLAESHSITADATSRDRHLNRIEKDILDRFPNLETDGTADGSEDG